LPPVGWGSFSKKRLERIGDAPAEALLISCRGEKEGVGHQSPGKEKIIGKYSFEKSQRDNP